MQTFIIYDESSTFISRNLLPINYLYEFKIYKDTIFANIIINS